jgi:hypothetical protein
VGRSVNRPVNYFVPSGWIVIIEKPDPLYHVSRLRIIKSGAGTFYEDMLVASVFIDKELRNIYLI